MYWFLASDQIQLWYQCFSGSTACVYRNSSLTVNFWLKTFIPSLLWAVFLLGARTSLNQSPLKSMGDLSLTLVGAGTCLCSDNTGVTLLWAAPVQGVLLQDSWTFSSIPCTPSVTVRPFVFTHAKLLSKYFCLSIGLRICFCFLLTRQNKGVLQHKEDYLSLFLPLGYKCEIRATCSSVHS